MKLHIRPPTSAEWPVCRMLLPETFGEAESRSYLLCLRDTAPRVVGAASFRAGNGATTALRLHVVSTFRRRGVGTHFVEHLEQAGIGEMEGTADVVREPAAEYFCLGTGFRPEATLITVESGIEEMRAHLGRLRDRVAPAGARSIPLSLAPLEQVARLHAEYVAHDDLNPWRALVAGTPGMEKSRIVMMEGQVAGILLWEQVGERALIRSRVVEPRYHGSWVNTVLLADSLDSGWADGARRVQFNYLESNRDTVKLAARFGAETISKITRFRRSRSSPKTGQGT